MVNIDGLVDSCYMINLTGDTEEIPILLEALEPVNRDPRGCLGTNLALKQWHHYKCNDKSLI